MPIILPEALPATKALRDDNIFVMSPSRAARQDIRPLEILVVNLMPEKISTETQLCRVLAGTPLQVRMTFVRTGSHESSHTPAQHMGAFYHTLDEIEDKRYDGMIITGAPIELLDYEQVDYWPEFLRFLEFGRTHAYSVIHLCWAGMAALWHRYGIAKQLLPQKLHGVFEHTITRPKSPLMRGLDERFWVPHSRQAQVDRAAVEATPGLRILAESREAGLHIVASEGGREIYIFGHMEYDRDTLWQEYNRDLGRRADAPIPRHYFEGDDPSAPVDFRWRANGQLFYANWLNYYVYQQTPYDLALLG